LKNQKTRSNTLPKTILEVSADATLLGFPDRQVYSSRIPQLDFLQILRAAQRYGNSMSFLAFNCAAVEIAQHAGRRALWQP
jgi:hypothetical protein